MKRAVTFARARAEVIGFVVLIAATAFLWNVSRGKWSDAVIDSGREWIVPDALARGELLYRDVVYWFGPFTPYFHAAFFALFGSGFRTLVVAGVVGSIGVLAALHFALRTVTGRRQAALWTALGIPALVFMPNAGGPILGMGYRIWHAAAFALWAIALAARPGAQSRPVLRAVAVGSLCALAGLCRTEWGLVAGAASFGAFLLREPSPSARLRGAATAGATFLAVFGGTLAAFIAAAGSKAVLEDGHVLLSALPEETREFLAVYSGIRDWPAGLLELAYSAATWTAVYVLLQILAIGRRDRPRVLRKLPLLAILLLVAILCAALAGAGRYVMFSAAPFVCAVAAVVGARARRPPGAVLFAFGLAGAVLSYRRPFHIGDAAYVGPPLLFAIVCAAGLVQRALDREPEPAVRERLRRYSEAAVLLLALFGFAGRALTYGNDDRIAVPGTQGMISALPHQVAPLEALASAVRREGRATTGLVVFPEGELLNYLTRRSNPVRHKLYIPGYLTAVNEREILDDLRRTAPGVIVVLQRATPEYGPAMFGLSYGLAIRRWIEENYEVRPIDPGEPVAARVGSWAVLAVRRRSGG